MEQPSAQSTTAIVERTYIDGIAYYDREKDLQRIADIQKEKGGRSTTEAAPVGTNGGGAGAGAAAHRPPEKFDVKGNANGPAWAITNARIVTVSGPVIPKGTIVIRGNRIEAVGANVADSLGRQADRRRRRDRDPGMIDASTDIGLNEPGVRNYDDVSEILPFDQMLRTRVAYRADSDAIPVARTEGITTVGVAPGRRHHQRRDAGDESRWLDVGGSTLRPAAGLALNFPGAARRPRRRRWRRRRGGAGAGRGTRSDEDAEPAARTGARLREAAGDTPDRLDPRAVPAGARSAGRRST